MAACLASLGVAAAIGLAILMAVAAVAFACFLLYVLATAASS